MADNYVRTPLEEVLFNARLIEQCQSHYLITPEERKNYIEKLNDKAHVEIEKILV